MQQRQEKAFQGKKGKVGKETLWEQKKKSIWGNNCDGKPARLSRTHRQGRGRKAAGPGRPRRVLPSPQQ